LGTADLLDVADVRWRVERRLIEFLSTKTIPARGRREQSADSNRVVADGRGKRLRAVLCYWRADRRRWSRQNLSNGGSVFVHRALRPACARRLIAISQAIQHGEWSSAAVLSALALCPIIAPIAWRPVART
jgi:hypothetical protein